MHSPPWNRARENWLFLLFIFYSFWKWKPPQITEYFNFLRPNHKHSPLPDTYSVYQYWKSAGCRNLKKGREKGCHIRCRFLRPRSIWGLLHRGVHLKLYVIFARACAPRENAVFRPISLYFNYTIKQPSDRT